MILPSHRTKEELNSGKKNPFVIEEPNSKKLLWYQWFNIRIRQYMILETFFFIIFIAGHDFLQITEYIQSER
ncbi:hypothetical protein B9Z55_020950 [Caenorhabditis nigoni]|uniref:Uncharacterized protein n=1 Tax=Caenorhabditis nigoni TaxID=1611254 RepID=A0A2G5TPV8_9PELO|nr:hypothetical protein B9Z55_020950 [Caenorhabditis nigoni]